ncbi:hypothetical protein [Streptomyces scabiei]|uniref:hypothetical protein n=1 Tax=Streptomyces scabiei TaxID=1930 RepID=UPI0029A2BBA2|nr:hypothetical protein [Streptomyces scabiei]MDX2538192.1 hypothetical protein [Streptomyces scabiei]MDX2799266.1 hypothetical protein [Streptomyces scabiei]MDX3827913.1 hypothetical protein [Streptomyces scabiei]
MHATEQIGRRTMLRAAGAAAVGLVGVGTSSVAAKVKTCGAPCSAGYAKSAAKLHAQSGCTARPQVIVYLGMEVRPGSTWPQSYGMTRQPVRIVCSRAGREQRPYPLIHPMCQRRPVFYISDDV